MRKIIVLLLVLLLVSCGKPDARDSQHQDVYFKNYSDKWIVLNYWASWCTSCYQEIPELNKLYQQHADKLVLFGINFDQDGVDEINQFAAKQQIGYPLLINDPGAQFNIHDIENLPATFLISPDRKQVIKLIGPQTAEGLFAKMKS